MSRVRQVKPGPPQSWMDSAACAGADTELFYADRSEDIAEALRFCATCEVNRQCLSFALSTGQQGVWGGTTWPQRRRMGAKAS